MSPLSATIVPRQVVRLGLLSARLPIAVAEHLTERAGFDISGFGPIAAYDSVEAQAKKVIGRVLGDDELVREGERQEKAARHRQGAEFLSERAEEVRSEADEQLEDRVERAERSRRQVRQRTEERKQEIVREEEEARRQAEEKARQHEEAVRQAAEVRDKAIEAKERQAELERIQAEQEALTKESEAVEAERVVTAIDEHLETKKATRRNGKSPASS